MSQGPFRNVRPPTKLHVTTRLVRTARISIERDEADAATGVSGKQARRGHARVA